MPSTNDPILIGDSAQPDPSVSTDGMSFLPLVIDLPEEKITLQIAFRSEQVTLIDLVPPARQLADLLADRALEYSHDPIACHKGCSHCCRYLVLMSVPQALALIECVASMPLDTRKNVIDVSCLAARRIYDLLPKPDPHTRDPQAMERLRSRVADWFNSDQYTRLAIDCPFLVNDSCSIYDYRPIACRQWLVIGDPAQCARGPVQASSVVAPLLNVPLILKKIAAELENAPEEVVALPCVFDWFQANRNRLARTFPAEELARRLLDAVQSEMS